MDMVGAIDYLDTRGHREHNKNKVSPIPNYI